MSVLTLLDLSAAFDTLDHSILLAWLHDMFCIAASYLSHRVQAVSGNGRASSQKKLHSLGCSTLYSVKSLFDIGAVITDLLMIFNFTSLQLHLTFIH